MLSFPERLVRGDVPNVDFLHLYGPGSLHVLAGWYGVFGHSLAAERTFGLLQHVAIILALFTLARPWGRLAATAVGVLAVFYVMTPIALTAMAWNGGLALTLWATVFAVRGIHLVEPARRRRAWVVAGAARRARPHLPPGPRDRRRSRRRLDAVAPPRRPPAGADRRGRRADCRCGSTS